MTTDKTPALTVRQPWAELLMSGHKIIEVRTWTTNYRGRIWIHSAKDADRAAFGWFDVDGLRDAPRGFLLGTMTLTDVVPFDEESWEKERYKHMNFNPFIKGLHGWHMTEPVRLSSPVPMSGKIGLWYPSI